MIDLTNPPSSIDLTAPPTNIGTTTPVAVNSTIFTALPANNTSAFVASGSSLTGSNAQSLVDWSQTWNSTGTPTAILLDITDTASNAASNLMDLRVGGVSKFAIRKSGAIAFTGTGIVSTLTTNSFGDTLQYSHAFLASALQSNSGLTIRSIGSVSVGSGGTVRWSSSTDGAGSIDLILVRDAANTLAQRNSTNTQTSRLYKSFTDASNYTRAAWQFDANGVAIIGESAGTGDANIDITFTPKGTGNVRFGTHSALAAETITGYIQIKDSSGTLRKLAVIS